MSDIFTPPPDNAIYLSRRDPEDPLGTFSAHAILLDDFSWPTAEHYFQAMRFESTDMREQIRRAPTPQAAKALGEPSILKRLFSRQRKDWENVRRAYMTRAMYTKCKAWPEVAEKLLATGDEKLVENDQYDYYWGCGRDLRGDNTYGKVLMDIRTKLREEGEA